MRSLRSYGSSRRDAPQRRSRPRPCEQAKMQASWVAIVSISHREINTNCVFADKARAPAAQRPAIVRLSSRRARRPRSVSSPESVSNGPRNVRRPSLTYGHSATRLHLVLAEMHDRAQWPLIDQWLRS